MVRSKTILAIPAAALSALFTLTLALPLSSVSYADTATAKPIGKIISVKQSGYATRLQQSVKHSVKAGDILYAGDQLDVKSGNVVQIALDSDKENIIHIPGDTLVQITKDRAINLEMSRGQVFALLDRLEPGTKFRVVTPTAVSTVRGTYFGVKMAGTSTETSVYRGEVGVNGRQADGRALGAAIGVRAGQKTSVAHTGTRPAEPKQMTEAEFNQINSVIAALDGLKKPVAYSDVADDETRADAERKNGNADVNPSAKNAVTDEEDTLGGKVVF